MEINAIDPAVHGGEERVKTVSRPPDDARPVARDDPVRRARWGNRDENRRPQETGPPDRFEVRSITRVTAATATLDGEDLGALPSTAPNHIFGEIAAPEQPLAMTGAVYLPIPQN